MYSRGAWMLLLACMLSLCSGTYIIGYWGAKPGGLQSSVPQLSAAINQGYNVIIYAFYDVDASGGLTQDGGAFPAPTKAAINSTKSFKYLVSLFGGQNGIAPTLSIAPSTWAQTMYTNFVALHNSHGFDGIDIDLENAWGGTGDKVICGLRAFFKLMHNGGYMVSMAPQTVAIYPVQVLDLAYSTGSWNSYAPLVDSTVIQYVDIVAVQLYNNAVPGDDIANYASLMEDGFQVSGCPDCGDGGTCYVQVPNCKIAFGYPTVVGAAPAGCPGLNYASSDHCPYGSTLSSLYNGNSVLKGTAGVMTWSIEYDQNANPAWPFVKAATAVTFTGDTCTKPPTVATATSHATTATTKSSTATSSTTNKPTTSTTTIASTTTTSAHTTASQSTTSQSSGQLTPSAGGAGTRFVGYWGTSPSGHTSSLTQLQTALTKGYNVIAYTYYSVDASGGLHAASGSLPAPVKNTISNSSFEYLASLFGTSGVAPTLTLAPDAWAQALYTSFLTLHKTVGFDGVDIELQNYALAWGGTANNLMCGLRSFFKLMHSNGYTVSLSAQTISLDPSNAVFQEAYYNSYVPLLDTGIIDSVDFVTVQMYGSVALSFADPVKFTTSLTTGFNVTGCPSCTSTSVTGLVKIPPCKLALGWPSATGASSAGCTGLQLSNDGCPYGSSLATLYPPSIIFSRPPLTSPPLEYKNALLTSTGGVTTWSIEWDEFANWQFITSSTSVKFASCKAAPSGGDGVDAVKASASGLVPIFVTSLFIALFAAIA